MTEKETLQHVGGAIAQDGIYVEVDISPRNWFHKKMQQYKKSPLSKSIPIKPLLVANMYRVASRAERLPNEIFTDGDGSLFQILMPIVAEHFDDILYIVAVCLQNNRHEPTQETIDFIKYNFTTEELVEVLMASFNTSKMEAFMNTIVLVKGTAKILKPKEPKTSQVEREIIARSE